MSYSEKAWASTLTFTYGRERSYTVPLSRERQDELVDFHLKSLPAHREPDGHLPLFIGSTHRRGAMHWYLAFPAFDKSSGVQHGSRAFDMINPRPPLDDYWVIRERGRDGAYEVQKVC